MIDINKELSDRLETFTQIFLNGDVEALADMHTIDTCIMPQNSEKITGINGARTMYEFIISKGLKDIKFKSEERLFMGDIVVERGEYWQLIEPDVEDRGNYLTVWKKIDDEWLFYWDMFNSNLPATT